jgi:hypothetical protein
MVAHDPSYAERGHAVVAELVGPELAAHLARYVEVLGATGRMEPDHQVPGSLRRYGAPGLEALLADGAAPLSVVTGRRLVPTYSFVRAYRRGQELTPHRDRPACEHSATLHLAASEPISWPLWVRREADDPTPLVLRPGDAAIYRGTELLHWREPLEAEWYVQAFLHYVDADGPCADEAFDRRHGLGAQRQLR